LLQDSIIEKKKLSTFKANIIAYFSNQYAYVTIVLEIVRDDLTIRGMEMINSFGKSNYDNFLGIKSFFINIICIENLCFQRYINL
jgi:hypothetical protein